MLENRNIIVFADDWGRYPSTIQHIGKILAKKNRIIWVGSLGLRKPEFKVSDIARVLEKLSKMIFKREKSTAEESPVIDFHPFVIPLHDNAIMRRINKFLLLSKLRKKIKELNFSNPILITCSPVTSDVIGELGESSSHYICLDDYSLFEGAFRSLIALEGEVLKKVDSCFATAKQLLETRRPRSGNSFFLPQGVDVGHFSKFSPLESGVTENNNRPIAGFFGLLAPWIDLRLIVRSALENQDVDFVIIGKSSIDIMEFKNIPNLKFIGEIPYEKLPEYSGKFNVGLIPFKVNDLTIAVNPLKLLEYMAIGIPVVSTKLPEVEKFSDLVFIAKDEDEFVQLIRTALLDNIKDRNMKRREVAQKYSWVSIIEDLSAKIEEIEIRKQSVKIQNIL